MNDLNFWILLCATIALGFLAMLLWNISLHVQNIRLRLDLFQRERWHERELAKWRERT